MSLEAFKALCGQYPQGKQLKVVNDAHPLHAGFVIVVMFHGNLSGLSAEDLSVTDVSIKVEQDGVAYVVYPMVVGIDVPA